MAFVYRALRPGTAARGSAAARGRRRSCRRGPTASPRSGGTSSPSLPTPRRPRPCGGSEPATSAGTRRRAARRVLPGRVRLPLRLPDRPRGGTGAVSPMVELSEAQRAAIERRGEVFVSAGAGTGKTRVLVERYLHGLVELGLGVEQIVAITYTNRAAGELTDRIRRRIAELPRDDVRTRDLERRLPAAWISTIGRPLRTPPPPLRDADRRPARLRAPRRADGRAPPRRRLRVRPRPLPGARPHRRRPRPRLRPQPRGRRRRRAHRGPPLRHADRPPLPGPVRVRGRPGGGRRRAHAIAGSADGHEERREDARELVAILELDADPRSFVHAEEDLALPASAPGRIRSPASRAPPAPRPPSASGAARGVR